MNPYSPPETPQGDDSSVPEWMAEKLAFICVAIFNPLTLMCLLSKKPPCEVLIACLSMAESAFIMWLALVAYYYCTQ